jgi:hypothetical protein
LKAKLSVNGVVLTGANQKYTIAMTDTTGNPFTPVDTAGSTYGGVTAGRFQYNIPMYDASQTGGAASGATACIAISYNGTPLTVTYPAQGSCPTGSGQITVQYPDQSIGFGGILGEPNDSSHTFASPITVTSSNVTAPSVDVQCGSVERNITTAESVGSAQIGPTPATDSTCEVGNVGVKTLSVTALTVSGCGFSLASPPATPTSLVTGVYTPITIDFAPCGVGVQTGILTVKSNDPNSPYIVPLTGNGSGSISLVPGWNLVSLLALPSSTDPGTLLSDSNVSTGASSVSIVWGYSPAGGGTWSSYVPGGSTNTLTTMTIGNGYWLDISGATEATLTVN